jgi:hypothetical protein
MILPPALANAKVVILTGAGASLPLGRYTTKEFVDHCLQTASPSLLAMRDQLIRDCLEAIEQRAKVDGWDIELILDRLERQAEACLLLARENGFARHLQQRNGDRVASYGHAMQKVADAIYDEVIRHYSGVNAERAAALYRPLLVDFLTVWFRGSPEVDLGRTLPFFTLNYDTAVEAAASLLPEVRLIDGLERVAGATERRWTRTVFERIEEDRERITVILSKMHGSVRWGRVGPKGNGGQDDIIAELPTGVGKDPGDYKHAVLYPTLAPKPVDVEPFRTGYRIFRECLRGARVLIAIGTSLRDPEVTAAIRDGMDDNPDLHLVVVSPSADHQAVAGAIRVNDARVAALCEKLDFPVSPDRSPLLGALRTFVCEACGYPQLGPTYFPGTYKCSVGPLIRVAPSGPLQI